MDDIRRSFKRKVGGCFQNVFLLLCITEGSAPATVAFPLLSSGDHFEEAYGIFSSLDRGLSSVFKQKKKKQKFLSRSFTLQ
ncbi:hypothetical protein CEXT_114381 [Caerostris extrusa]|uniref:Secreted protein n=1 Tax=Caerostris extrusa TaxID=172846 RepID=A0AAV4YBG5_CAEEX|nr:hypothetical protein CEXT_114381 [Caerostris extrusa]